MNITLLPYISVNQIRFGMSSQEVINVLKREPIKFKKDITDKFESEDYDLFIIYYDITGKCEAIEFNIDSNLCIFDIYVFETPYIKLKNIFNNMDPSLETMDDGFISPKYGFSVYLLDESDIYIESIIFFCENYY